MLAGGDGTDVSDRSEERNAGDERITRGVVEATDGSHNGLSGTKTRKIRIMGESRGHASEVACTAALASEHSTTGISGIPLSRMVCMIRWSCLYARTRWSAQARMRSRGHRAGRCGG